MLGHLGVNVPDLRAAKTYYDAVMPLLGFDEFEYLALFLWLAIAGPGVLSLDHLIQRWYDRSTRGAATTQSSVPEGRLT